MINGELETMERYVQELEALKFYAQVKAERDSLAAQAAQVTEKAAQLEGQLQSEVSTRKQLSSRLSKSESEAKELGGRLAQAETELSSLKDFRMKLPEGLTLKEMREQFLQVQEEEIERRAEARLGELEKELHSRMPALVHQRLIELIKHPGLPPEIDEVIRSQAREMANESLRDKEKWPDWFKNHYLHQVDEAVGKRLDAEFESRVQTEAQKRLDAMKAGQWQEYTAAKARELGAGLKGALSQLQGAWRFTCDRCSRQVTLDIGASEVGELLGGRTVDVACPTCTDPAPFPFILSTVAHKVGSLTLGNLLRLYMGQAPSTGRMSGTVEI